MYIADVDNIRGIYLMHVRQYVSKPAYGNLR